MREILFRGKITQDEWVYGFYENVKLEEATIHYINGKIVSSKTVGQYTGLTDKNGKKIFEGDIIDTPDRLVKVVWFEGNAQFDLHFIRYKDDVTTTNFKGIHMRDLKEYEVIGNIHDNSELLEG